MGEKLNCTRCVHIDTKPAGGPCEGCTAVGLATCVHCGALAMRTSAMVRGLGVRRRLGFRVECCGCHMMTCYWHTQKEADSAWNTRPAPEEGVDLAGLVGFRSPFYPYFGVHKMHVRDANGKFVASCVTVETTRNLASLLNAAAPAGAEAGEGGGG